MTAHELIMALLLAHAGAVEDGIMNPPVQILVEVEMFSDVQFANGDAQAVTYHEGVITISGTALQGEAQ